LDIRPRSALSLNDFLANASAPLIQAALPAEPERVRQWGTLVLQRELHTATVHVMESTWTVPLHWFALVEPEERTVVLATQNDPDREVSWRMALPVAVRRAEAIAETVLTAFGPGAVHQLRALLAWLGNFDKGSVVELDYGGLVQLLSDEAILADTSAADTQALVSAMQEGDTEATQEAFGRIRDFWGSIALKQRNG
jgi:hypothetical protein